MEPSMKIPELFDLTGFDHASLFAAETPPWQPLVDLKEYMNTLPWQENPLPRGVPLKETIVLHNGEYRSADNLDIHFDDAAGGKLTVHEADIVLDGASVLMAGAIFQSNRLLIGRGVLVESGAMIKGATVLGDCCEVRQGAYLRGWCLAGKGCIIGHATEVKHSIFLNNAKAGHFAYIGDSILGGNVNLGAGTKLANLRFLPGNVFVKSDGEDIDTGLRKLGAILGDDVQTGCNSVTSPGVVLGRGSLLLPNITALSGAHKAKTVLH